jgi:predicted nuclease with TOPRIM domain
MSQQTKITEAEFSEIKRLQGKFQELHGKFGNLGIEKMELDRMVNEFVEREKKLKEEWIMLKKMDEELRDKLVTTYGDGSLSMDTGEFIPLPVQTK